jgi:hypothetical protein
MPVFEFTSTLSPGYSTRWWTGGNGWYAHDHRPQLDAHPVPTFPEGVSYTGVKVPFWYGDFGSQVEDTDFFGNDHYTYYVTVRNEGAEPAQYHMRVWVP